MTWKLGEQTHWLLIKKEFIGHREGLFIIVIPEFDDVDDPLFDAVDDDEELVWDPVDPPEFTINPPEEVDPECALEADVKPVLDDEVVPVLDDEVVPELGNTHDKLARIYPEWQRQPSWMIVGEELGGQE